MRARFALLFSLILSLTVGQTAAAGYWVQGASFRASNVLDKEAQRIFTQQASLRTALPAQLPAAFTPLIKRMQVEIDRLAPHAVQKNRITNAQLAEKIVRLSFCFATDPRMVTAQIGKESAFDHQQVSSTGAVGFTQMTGDGIDEVNDQLGNQDSHGANPANLRYIANAFHCYLSSGSFKTPWASDLMPRGQLITKNPAALARVKRWLQTSLDRDLLYGQLNLKILLATAAEKHEADVGGYVFAFEHYNGEAQGRDREYAIRIIRRAMSL